MKNADIDLKAIQASAAQALHALRKYANVLIFLVFTGVYGFMIVHINSLSNPTIDESEVLAEAKSLPAPKIDEESAKKLQSLKDNSVNVQTLFEQGRTDPFQ